MGDGSSTSFLAIVLMALTLLLAVQGSSAFRSMNRETIRQIRQKAFGEHLSRTSTRKLLTVPRRPEYAKCPAGTLEGYDDNYSGVRLFFCQDCFTNLSNKFIVTKSRNGGVSWPPISNWNPLVFTNRAGSYMSCKITRCPKGMTPKIVSDDYYLYGQATNGCEGTQPARILRMPDPDGVSLEKFQELDNLCKNMFGTPLASLANYYEDKFLCSLANFPLLYPICKTKHATERKKLFKHLNHSLPDGVHGPSDFDLVTEQCAHYRLLPGFDS